jgi:hypothetical protein
MAQFAGGFGVDALIPLFAADFLDAEDVIHGFGRAIRQPDRLGVVCRLRRFFHGGCLDILVHRFRALPERGFRRGNDAAHITGHQSVIGIGRPDKSLSIRLLRRLPAEIRLRP